MNRPYRHADHPKATPVPVPILWDRVLVGAFAALVVARPLVPGDDPGRLRLTSSGGPLSFNLCLLLVFVGFAAWRIAFARTRPNQWAVVPILLAAVGISAFASSRLPDRYAHPGIYIGWEWVGLAVAYYLTRRVTASVADSRGILNVVLASAVSIGGLALYQAAALKFGLPTTDVVVPPTTAALAGDDEFYPELNRPADPTQPRGTFDSPETLFISLMLVLPAAVAMARAGRASTWPKWVFAILVAAAVVTLLLRPFGERGGHWASTINLFTSHPLLGVGPGNLSRELNAAAGADGAWFAVAATTGAIGLGLWLAAIGVAAYQARPSAAPDPVEPKPTRPRWEFYYGGIGGLLIGFIWAAGAMPAESTSIEVFRLGATAVARAILWFAAFAVLETVRPTRAAIGRAILVGAGLAIAFGLASDAPGRPTVLFPLLVLLAVGANLRSADVPARPDGGWTRPVRIVRAFATVGAIIAFLVTAAVPAWETASAVRQARMASRHYRDLRLAIDQALPGPDRTTKLTNAHKFLLHNIILPLREAAVRDPYNSALILELARWRRPLWEYQLVADPQDAIAVAVATREAAERAARLDPHNPAAPRSFFEALLLYRLKSTTKQPERVVAMNKVIAQIAERRPDEEVPLRFRLVQTLLVQGDPEEAKPELIRLCELNHEGGHGKLTDDQKEQLRAKAPMIMSGLPEAVWDELGMDWGVLPDW